MDSVEAVSTFGAYSRFHCRGDTTVSKGSAGCILCRTVPYHYNIKSSSLPREEARLRNSAQMEAIRARDIGTKEGDKARSVAGMPPCAAC